MINLVIDTCSWRQLISKNEISKELVQIEFWVKNKEVNLFCPEVVKYEWIKHRNIELDVLSKAIRNHEKNLKLFNVPIADSQRELAKEILESQVRIVDELLQMGTVVLTSDSAKIRTTDHATKSKAPFHNKKDSISDALLIFSSLDYSKENSFVELTFLSDNYNDFANSEGTKIHSDISDEYEEIVIRYFRKPQDLIKTLIDQNGLSPIKADEDLILLSNPSTLILSKNSSIIDQLHEYISKRYNEISFYPLHLLKHDFPFKASSSFWSHYGLFTLHTDNSVLFSLFESLKISETNGIAILDLSFIDNVENPENKIETIVRRLNANLVFNIGNQALNRKIDIRYTDNKVCDCVRCNFNRFNFQLSLEHLSPEEGDEADSLIKKAYINYQFGNFIESAAIFEKVAEWAEKNEKYTTLFLAKYNLSKLSIFLENHYWGGNSQHQLVSKLREIDLERLARNVSTSENRKLIEWILKGSFYSEPLIRMQSLASDLRDNYYLQLEGGFSSNSTVWNLINEFGAFDSFLNQNFIIYDSFAEFFDLVEIFTESVIASHAVPESQGSKLHVLDDYILKRLVYYGNTVIIRKYVRRYNLKHFKYKPSSPEGDTFLDVCFNFLDGYSSTSQYFSGIQS